MGVFSDICTKFRQLMLSYFFLAGQEVYGICVWVCVDVGVGVCVGRGGKE